MLTELVTVLGPGMVVALGALVALAAEPFLRDSDKHSVLPWVAGVSLFLAAMTQVVLGTTDLVTLGSMFATDEWRGWLTLAVLACGLCGAAGLQHSLRRDEYPGGEGYALTLLATCGAILMVAAIDFIALFVGLELMSISIYGLVGLRRNRNESNEALFKYLIMGAVFSAIFLYGIAMHYGATGSTAYAAPVVEGRDALSLLAGALLLIGLLFKVGAVPFHFWSPDAYTGAPIAVTGFMAGAVKIGGFTTLGVWWLARLDGSGQVLALADAVQVLDLSGLARLGAVVMTIAFLSLLLGNFSALGQSSIRRMMAFSSVSHAGYMLLALTLPGVNETFDLRTLWFYLIAYAVASAGLLAGITAISGSDDADDLQNLAGAARRHPLLGAGLTLLVASLAGLPPTAGFLGKYLILGDLVAQGHIVAALIAMLVAAVGLVYYLRFVVVLWSERGEQVPARGPSALGWICVGLAAVVTLGLLLGAPEGVHMHQHAELVVNP